MSYFLYVRNLRFEEKPDYAYLRRMFRDLFAKEGKLTSNPLDHLCWFVREQGTSSVVSHCLFERCLEGQALFSDRHACKVP